VASIYTCTKRLHVKRTSARAPSFFFFKENETVCVRALMMMGRRRRRCGAGQLGLGGADKSLPYSALSLSLSHRPSLKERNQKKQSKQFQIKSAPNVVLKKEM